MRFRTKLALIAPIYTAAVWFTAAWGMSGDDLLGLLAVLLGVAGCLVVVQALWMKERPVWIALLLNLIIFTVFGAAAVTVGRGNIAVGIFFGFVIGLLSGLAAWWLGGGSVFRPRPTVFLSYRRQDSAYACSRIYEALVEKFGSGHVFRDINSIPLGRDFKEEISRVTSRCQAVLIVIGTKWLNATDADGRRRLDQPADFVRVEIETAFESKVPVIPVFVDDGSPPDAEQLPPSLASLNRLQGVTLGRTFFEADLASLVQRIRDLMEEHHGEVFATETAKARYSSRLKALLTAAAVIIFFAPLVFMLLVAATASSRRLSDAALSPDGNHIAAIYGSHKLRMWNASTGENVVQLTPPGGPFLATTEWSPDGKWLAVGIDRGEIHVWRWPGLGERKILSGAQGFMDRLAWAPNSGQLAAGGSHGHIWVWDVTTTNLIFSQLVFRKNVAALAWSPVPRLASGSWDQRVGVHDISAGTSVMHNLRASHVEHLAWSADGTYLAIATLGVPFLSVFRIDKTGNFYWVPVRAYSRVMSLAWSPVGGLLAVNQGSNQVNVWDVAKTTDEPGNIAQPQHVYQVEGLGLNATADWSPDGKLLAVTDEFQVKVWDVNHDRMLEEHKTEDAQLVGWMPDGRQFVTRTSYKDTLQVWELGTSSPLAEMKMGIWESLWFKFF